MNIDEMALFAWSGVIAGAFASRMIPPTGGDWVALVLIEFGLMATALTRRPTLAKKAAAP